MFVPLHTKSDYSLGYGTATIEELVGRAVEDGYPALALTDVENLYGLPRFYAAARRTGVRPITGLELRQGYGPGALGDRKRRLVLLARDRAGYASLCRIVTARRGSRALSSEVSGILDLNLTGLFFLSDDVSVLKALIEGGVSNDDVRFLLVRPGGNDVPEEFKPVADPDIVMLEAADHPLHSLLVSIRRRQSVFGVTGVEPPERSLPKPADLRALFADQPEALEEAGRIADACRFDLGNWPRPSLLPPAGEPPEESLERLCRERFEAGRRDGRWTEPRYAARLERELSVFREVGLGDYVLAVTEITDYVHSLGIPMGGRGSAGSSLILHVLGVTPLDPIVYGLLFERFVHAGRRDLPDIDLDLPSDRRDQVLEWVLKRFGTERAAMASAHQTFRRRSAYREGLKALGMSTIDVNRFAERMPPDELEDALPIPEHMLTGRYRDALPLMRRLVGKMQHISVHPGGVVLATPRVSEFAPLERAPKGVPVTQYDLRGLASIGLLKIDLLGNRALTAIEEAQRTIGRMDMPDKDKATLYALQHADTIGCFQIETPPMRSVLRQLPLSGILDLMAALAIVRPGPASGEAKADFIRRERGEGHASGILLYEEDLIAAIANVTGRSLAEADQLRVAIASSEGDAPDLAGLEENFIEDAIGHGVDRAEAERVWTSLTRFAAYAFNKAHAAGYAHLAWQTAFLKTHAPGAFGAAVLNSYGGIYPLRTLAADLARHEIRLSPPHVNLSGLTTTWTMGAVQVGLAAIKHLTHAHRNAILNCRPFRTVRHLLEHVPLSIRELQALVRSGACDDLPPLPKAAYPIAHEALLDRYQQTRDPRTLDQLEPGFPGGPRAGLYAALVRVKNELTYLDMHVSDHPMRLLRGEAVLAGCVTIHQAETRRTGFVRLAVIVATARRLESRGGELMQFVTFEDETGLLEAVLFPGTFALLGDPIREPGPFLVGGRLAEEQGDLHLVVGEATPFYERRDPYRPIANRSVRW